MIYVIRSTKTNDETASLHSWSDRPGHGQPVVFALEREAQEYLDGLRHSIAKYLKIVRYGEVQ